MINRSLNEGLKANKIGDFRPFISVIVTVYNEEKVIESKLQNLLTLEYSAQKVEIIVASDGSTDRTVEIANQYAAKGLVILDFKENRGKAAVQNDAVRIARGDIIVFTDADTRFQRDFLKNTANKFINSSIGCVTGKLKYITRDGSISQAEGIYWRYELKLRELESRLGILTATSGACLALRKKLFKPLGDIDGEDNICPLDCVLQGYKVVYAPEATAYDEPPSSTSAEFNSRIRITARSFSSIIRKWGFINWFKHPAISFGLLSHRFLRWLMPYFMVMVFISNIFLLDQGWFYQLTFGGQIAFYLAGLIGWIGEVIGKRIPIASTVFSFCVANLGMMIGVARGILGKAPASYKMPD